MENKYICIHGHFYQPPRENPWLGQIEIQDSAHPYRNWNERIDNECYGRNGAARVLNSKGKIIKIINNYEYISFNFGPTLLEWLKQDAKDTYKQILRADTKSAQKTNGNGNAMAQVYNHIIMPLATYEDKKTQVIWGIKDFIHRFRRMPKGMWLAETAVDTESLEVLAKYKIAFTVLAPRQAQSIRKMGDKNWHSVNETNIDTRRPYLINLPSGNNIVVFFYDGSVSRDVAFNGMLNDGKHFAHSLMRNFDNNQEPQLVNIAIDGETFGHHHKSGEMALAYCVHYTQECLDAKIINYSGYLEKFPPTYEARIHENSSWSCVHGIERWRSNCGCAADPGSGWSQEWRTTLRDTFNKLRDKLFDFYMDKCSNFTDDPLQARNDVIQILLATNKVHATRKFVCLHRNRLLSQEERKIFLRLMQMQYNSMLMFTSCGWFFDEVSGLEPTQNMRYADRACAIYQKITKQDISIELIEKLSAAKSNLPQFKNAKEVFEAFVLPSRSSFPKIAMYLAFKSLLFEKIIELKNDRYKIYLESFHKREFGGIRAGMGKILMQSLSTLNKYSFYFVACHLHLENMSFIGGYSENMPQKEFAESQKLFQKIEKIRVSNVLDIINKYFSQNMFFYRDLLKENQREIARIVLQREINPSRNFYEDLYEKTYAAAEHLANNTVQLPYIFESNIKVVLVYKFLDIFADDVDMIDIQALRKEIKDIQHWKLNLQLQEVALVIANKILQMMRKLDKNIRKLKLIENITSVLTILQEISIDINLWRSQNHFLYLYQKHELAQKKETLTYEAFMKLGEALYFDL